MRHSLVVVVPAKPKQTRKNKRKTEAIDFEEDDNLMDFLSRDTPLESPHLFKAPIEPLVNFSLDSDDDEMGQDDVPPVMSPPVQAAIIIDEDENDDIKPKVPEEEEEDDEYDPEPDTEDEEDAIIMDGPSSISIEQPLVDFVAVSEARGAVAAVREMGTTVGKLLESSKQGLAVDCLRVARASVESVSTYILLPSDNNSTDATAGGRNPTRSPTMSSSTLSLRRTKRQSYRSSSYMT